MPFPSVNHLKTHYFSRKLKTPAATFLLAIVCLIPAVSHADSLLTQRATHSVQLLDNVRAGALAYYAKHHEWPITSATPTNLNILQSENYVSGLNSHYVQNGLNIYEPVSAFVDPNSHSLVILLNILEGSTEDNAYAARFITDNLVSTDSIVNGNHQIKVVVPPPPASSSAATSLSSVAVPGSPQLNQMHTALDMQSTQTGMPIKNDIRNVNNLDAQNLTVGDRSTAPANLVNQSSKFSVFGTSMFSDKATFGDGTATGSVNHTLNNQVSIEVSHAAVVDEISAGEIGVDDLTVYNSSVFDENATVNFKDKSVTTFESGSTVNFNPASTQNFDGTVNQNGVLNLNAATNMSGKTALLDVKNSAGIYLHKDASLTAYPESSVHLLPRSYLEMNGDADMFSTMTYKNTSVTNFEAQSNTTFEPNSVLNLDGKVNFNQNAVVNYLPNSTTGFAGKTNFTTGSNTTYDSGSTLNLKGDTNLVGADVDIDSTSTLDVAGVTNFTNEVTYADTSDVTFNGEVTFDSINDIKLANGNSFADELKSSIGTKITAKPSRSSYSWNGGLKAGECKQNVFLDEGLYTVKYIVDSFDGDESVKQKVIAIRYETIYGMNQFRTEIFSTPTFDAKGDHEYAFKIDFLINHAVGTSVYCLKANVYKNNKHAGWDEKHDRGWWAGMAHAIVYEITPIEFTLN